MTLVLPKNTVELIKKVTADNNQHPGLQLDKFSIVGDGDQKAQQEALDKACKTRGDPLLLKSLTQRHEQALKLLPGAGTFCCTTTGPLTLHLSRASALENAGICLHPIYGFAYLPGSGLKGMAHAYAETVWLPVQEDQKQAWKQIEDVFGWAPNPDRRRQINDPNHPAEARRKDDNDTESPEIKSSSGNIVFHDAWPTAWPGLLVDIVNNHHPDYYQNDDNDHPPGDWEDPNPVYFLAVKPGTAFTFALSKRCADVSDDLINLARQWLLGALCHLGAGAKTNAGYGAFKLIGNDTDSPLLKAVEKTWEMATMASPPKRAVFTTMLELVTPAFLAGAEQYGSAARDGCDLRPATLRGHLRWWWRTMHAGFLDMKTLHALEAAIWGDTHAGGAVRIVIQPVNEQDNAARVQTYDKRSKATQGLWYVSYGMDEGHQNSRHQRYVLEPPASWRLRFISRPSRFFTNRADAADPKKDVEGNPIHADQVLDQAKAALWLLCHFSAVGSKARKGFGSLAASGFDGWTLEKCRETAEQFRTAPGLTNRFIENQAHSSSLYRMLNPVEVVFSWPNVWQVLDQVGFAYQASAKKDERKRLRMALGLPRLIGNPAQGTFNPTPPVTTDGRHSSPVHIHITRSNGGWLIRCMAFPAAHLPNLNTSTAFLTEFIADLRVDLQRRAALQPPSSGSTPASNMRRQQPPAAPAGPSLPSAGDRVEAVLLEEKTKKGGWKAKHEPSGLAGPIHNSGDVSGDKQPGDKITLIVASANPQQLAFRYPTAADEQRDQISRSRSGGGPDGGRRQRPR